MARDFWYNSVHFLTFISSTGEEKNTWTDWHLIPTSRPMVAHPGVSTKFVEIPGRGAPLDLTTYLTGHVVYGPRNGSWEFAIANGFSHWETIRQDIVSFLHGLRLKVILDDVPGRYYEGRFSVDTLKSGESNTMVTITYSLDPYSHAVLGMIDDWLWDPFNFETDYTDGRERVDIL